MEKLFLEVTSGNCSCPIHLPNLNRRGFPPSETNSNDTTTSPVNATETTAINTPHPKDEPDHLLLAFLITTLCLCISITLVVTIHHFLKRRRLILSQDSVTWKLPLHHHSLNHPTKTQHSTSDIDTSEVVPISRPSSPLPIIQSSHAPFINQPLSLYGFTRDLIIMDYTSVSSFAPYHEGSGHEKPATNQSPTDTPSKSPPQSPGSI